MNTHSNIDFKKELKLRFLYIIFTFFLSVITAFWQRDLLFYFFLKPLIQNSTINFDEVLFFKITEALQAQLYISLSVGFFISLPFLWLQLWFFLAPALYIKEQKLFSQLILSSLSFLFCGVLFAKNFLIPRAWTFFLSFGSLTSDSCETTGNVEKFSLVNDLQFLPSVVPYLEFSFEIFFSILLSSQVPLLLFLALHWNWVSKEFLIRKRPFIIIFFLSWAAVLSPPDLMSQIIIFAPLYISYEFLILCLFWQNAFRKFLLRN